MKGKKKRLEIKGKKVTGGDGVERRTSSDVGGLLSLNGSLGLLLLDESEDFDELKKANAKISKSVSV